MNSLKNPECLWPEVALGRDGGRNQKLRIMLLKGSSNSTGDGRANTSAFLSLGGVCPQGYSPGQRNYFPVLPSRPDIEFIVGRPQDAPFLASRGCVHGFIAFGDVVCEAKEAGVRGIEHLLELPFGTVDVVMVVPRASAFTTVGGLLASTPAPVRCVSELPFLARKAFQEERGYRKRFGSVPPAVDLGGVARVGGNPSVRVIQSAGSCEPQVTAGFGFYDCAVVVRSSGGTIRECGLKIIKTVGTYHPGFFCQIGLQEHPLLGPKVSWFLEGLETARRRWEELYGQVQPELSFGDDVIKCRTAGQVCPQEQGLRRRTQC